MIDTTDAQYTAVPGVYAKPGVVLNSTLRGFAVAVRARFGLPIVITSGVRTTAEQAAAMRTKVQLGGAAELRATYRGATIEEVIAGGIDSTAAIQRTLDTQVGRGVFLSRHMRADALDFRSTGYPAADLARLQAVCRELGADTLLETTPAHLHVEEIPGYFAALDPLAIGGAAAAAGFLAWVYLD